MKRILVTGGGGYIGSQLVQALLLYDYNVRVLDLFTYGAHLLKPHHNLECIKGDIRDVRVLRNALMHMDCVIHLACVSNDPGYELDAQAGFEINFSAFEPLLKLSIDQGITRFIYPSSCSVYGTGDGLIEMNESSRTNPLTDYAKCKLKCEEMLQQYSSENFYTTIFRPATVCGVSSRQRFDLSVNALINQFFHCDKVVLKGPECIRPSLHIKDMVNCYIVALQNDNQKLSGSIFNLAYQNLTVAEIAAKLSETLNKDPQFEYIHTTDQRSYAVNSKKANKIYGLTPNFTLQDAAIELTNALASGMFIDSLNNKYFYNKKVQKETFFPRFQTI